MARVPDEKIVQFILENLDVHPRNIVQFVTKEFSVSRQTASSYLARLIAQGVITGKGSTSARTYHLKPLDTFSGEKHIIPEMPDDQVWRLEISPRLQGLVSKKVYDICQYAFTEMFNNVIDHSETDVCSYTLSRDAIKVRLNILDAGVGIFEKIRKAFDLEDRRHALLELSKGKLTTDSKKHSGEGIFFTSRAMDRFSILSSDLYYCKRQSDNGWLIDVDARDWNLGTLISMEIHLSNEKSLKDVFDKYSTGEDYGFAKTHVPLALAKHESENLVSRSQARRLLARVDRFQEVLLDFDGIDAIGQAFADEVFRVFANEHPEIKLIPFRATPEVQDMIQRAQLRTSDPNQGKLL